MALFNVRTRDDRGADVVFRDAIVHRNEVDKATREHVNRASDRSQRWLLVLVVAMMLAQIPMWMQRSGRFILFGLVFTAVFTAFFWFVVLPPARQAMWNRSWKARYKQVGRCPACQYDLRGLEPQSDGCTPCPECGGAWRLPTPRPLA